MLNQVSRKSQENAFRYLEHVHCIFAKVWDNFDRCMNSLHALFVRLDGRMKDVFPGVSKYSPAVRASVTLITVMTVLIGSMVVVELIYHARPYYWMVLYTVLYLLYVIPIFIITVICKIFTAFYGIVLSMVKLVVFIIAGTFSVVIHSVSFMLRMGWLVLEFVVHVANWIIKAPWKVLISCLFAGLVSVVILVSIKKKHPVKVSKPDVARGKRVESKSAQPIQSKARHSPSRRAVVTLITVMTVLIGSMVVFELIYHARPYYWMVLYTVLYLLYVILIFIITVICKIFTAFYGIVLSMVKLVVFIIAGTFPVVIRSVSFTLRMGWLVLEFVIHVANWIIIKAPWKVRISCLSVGLVSVVILASIKRKQPVKVSKPDVAREKRVESKPAQPIPSKAKERSGPVASSATDGTRALVICPAQLIGKCAKGSQCHRFHCSSPYYWLYKMVDSEQWKNFLPPDNVKIERLFCDALEENTAVETTLGINYFTSSRDGEGGLTPNSPRVIRWFVQKSKEVRQQWSSLLYSLKFDEMTMTCGNSKEASIRRLSTPSYVQEPGEVLSTTWVWYWLDNDGWKQYGVREGSTGPKQEDIEASYIRGDKLFPFSTSSHNYHITFCDVLMYQRNLDPQYLTMRNVRRRPLFVSEADLQEIKSSADSSASPSRLPSHWTTLPRNRDFVRVSLCNSRELEEVEKLFHETIKKHEGSILEVERVQNPFLWERYARKRDQMKRKLKSTLNYEIERKLFHGTSSFVVDAICKHNFDHRLHGKHGTLYGEGSYFSTKASYSNNYSNQNGAKTRFMFLANILTGTYTQGHSSMRRPPSRDPSDPVSDLYDSCVDNVESPSIFVIFHDEQCYPLYLIKYRMSCNKV